MAVTNEHTDFTKTQMQLASLIVADMQTIRSKMYLFLKQKSPEQSLESDKEARRLAYLAFNTAILNLFFISAIETSVVDDVYDFPSLMNQLESNIFPVFKEHWLTHLAPPKKGESVVEHTYFDADQVPKLIKTIVEDFNKQYK